VRPPTPRPRNHVKAVLGAATAGLLLTAGAVVGAPPSAAATSGPSCQVSYSITNAWSDGFSANVTLTDTGPAWTSWDLGFTFPGNQQVTEGWDGTWTQSGETVSAVNASYNGAVASGGDLTIGFNGSFTGTDANPSAFTVNGTVCGGATTGTPSPSATASASPTPTPTPTPTASSTASSGAAPQLHVSGNKLENASGQTVVLHGVDRSGTEYECVQGTGIFDGPSDQASVTAMKSWGVTAVRIPLNEACWNSESYVNSAYAGAAYQSAIESYVSLLNANGIDAILDLHWTDGTYTGNSSGCSSAEATCEKPMPDSAESVPFWSSVATAFKGNDAVVFDLFNEPYPDRALSTETAAWQCWLNGGSSCTAGISYPVAGMQTLVNTVRATGANNVIMLGGLAYANDLTQWSQYEPTDPDGDLTASWHSYNFNSCSTQSCWTSQIAPVIAKVPLITGELGENDCAGTYIDPLMTWLDSENTSYLAWTWDDWSGDCSSGPTLITDYSGDATAYGAAYKAHLQSLG